MYSHKVSEIYIILCSRHSMNKKIKKEREVDDVINIWTLSSGRISKEILRSGSAWPGVDLRFCPWLLLFKYLTGGSQTSPYLSTFTEPGIDSEESISLAYVVLRATTYGVVVPSSPAGNRFLGSVNGLQIRVLSSFSISVPITCTSRENLWARGSFLLSDQ